MSRQLEFIRSPDLVQTYRRLQNRSGILRINGVECQCEREDIDYIGLIGEGSFGRVEKARMVTTNKFMAIKIRTLTSDPEKNAHTVMDLDVIMRSQRCPYIVQCYGFFIYDSEVRICMELMAISFDRLLEKLHDFPEFAIARIVKSVLRALRYLQKNQRVTYRDLKPSNILADGHGRIKLCDFGISGIIVNNSNSIHSGAKGCMAYLPPERLQGMRYSVKADVWSLGITIYEMAAGRHPYESCSEFELFDKIMMADPPRLRRDEFSRRICDFTSHCLQKDPENRFSFNQLLVEPFIKNYDEAEWREKFREWLRFGLGRCHVLQRPTNRNHG